MDHPIAVALLIAGLVLPAALFVLLRTRTRAHGGIAAAVAIAAGWACNVAWAVTSQAPGASAGTDDYVVIAANYGWFCPAVVVALTWLVLRFVRGSREAR